MHIVSKYEAVGIFVSVAIMAVALASVRFLTDTFTHDTQVAQVASVGVSSNDTTLEEALRESVQSDGTLGKLVTNDVHLGIGEGAKEGDTVTVHYTGTLVDGTVFDSSLKRGEPFTFTLGEGQVIAGWEAGILGMKVGGERVLVIPPDLAYGNRQVGPIPPEATLLFSVELLSIE